MATVSAPVLALDICDDIATLRIARPAGYSFAAGQWLLLTLPTAEGDQTKTFTIASAPADGHLEVTTRLSGSAFKNRLAELAPGDAVSIGGPGGRLRLPADAATMVFLAGGVGITPVRSLVRDAVGAGTTFDDAIIVYGNREPACVPYAEELAALRPAGVRLVPVYERAPESWEGARGFIGAELVRRVADPVAGRTFMVTGPPVMVSAMLSVLDELEVDPGHRIIERFGPA